MQESIEILEAVHLATPANRQLIAEHTVDEVAISNVFSTLHNAELLSQKNTDLVLEHAGCAWSITRVLFDLERVGLLSQENVDYLCSSAEYAREIAAVFRCFERTQGCLSLPAVRLLASLGDKWHSIYQLEPKEWACNRLFILIIHWSSITPLQLQLRQVTALTSTPSRNSKTS